LRDSLANSEEKIITHVSNFRPVKRVLDVIRIFNKIQENISSKLLMVGDGPDREKAENLARKLGIKNKILFMGKSDEVREILCLSDLFLLPSETESFGLAALEAMAAKTPVISTNTGGLSEVNINGETGFLSDVGNVSEMAKNSIYLLKDEERLDIFKENAYKVAHKFSIDIILPHYEEMYRRVKENCC
jgi:N-acetyl-alpha-D-glucosaminyl L-malate synthase BshA